MEEQAKPERFTLSLPPYLRAELEALADAGGRSLGAEIRRACLAHVSRERALVELVVQALEAARDGGST